MKKSIELKQKVNTLRDELRALLDEGKNEQAEEKAKELKAAMKAYDAAIVLEAVDQMAMGDAAPANSTGIGDVKAKNRAFVKAVMGRDLTDSEKAYARTLVDTIGTPGQAVGTPAKGGYLVPTEQLKTILEYRRHNISLKDDCDVIPVQSANGWIPTVEAESAALVNFDELTNISETDKDFSKIDWALKSYGTVIPISNELLADNDVDLVGFIARRFATMGINAENAAIFAIMAATTIAQTGTDYKAILKALNLKLDAAIAANATIYTDAIGFDCLDEMEDKNGRPLLTSSYADPAAKVFRGHPVKVLPGNLAVGSTEKKVICYVGNLKDAVKFFDREGVTIATSYEAGFAQNKALMRAVERFDVKAADTKAMVKVTINIPEATQATGGAG